MTQKAPLGINMPTKAAKKTTKTLKRSVFQKKKTMENNLTIQYNVANQ